MLGWAVMCSSRGCLSLWKRIRLWVCGNVQLEERRYPWGEGGWDLEENRGLLFLCGVLVLDQTLEQTWKNSSSTHSRVCFGRHHEFSVRPGLTCSGTHACMYRQHNAYAHAHGTVYMYIYMCTHMPIYTHAHTCTEY